MTFNIVWLVIFVIAGIGLARRNRLAYLAAIFLAIGGGVANGTGHLALALRTGGYFPGLYTGVLSLLMGAILTYHLLHQPRSATRTTQAL